MHHPRQRYTRSTYQETSIGCIIGFTSLCPTCLMIDAYRIYCCSYSFYLILMAGESGPFPQLQALVMSQVYCPYINPHCRDMFLGILPDVLKFPTAPFFRCIPRSQWLGNQNGGTFGHCSIHAWMLWYIDILVGGF